MSQETFNYGPIKNIGKYMSNHGNKIKSIRNSTDTCIKFMKAEPFNNKLFPWFLIKGPIENINHAIYMLNKIKNSKSEPAPAKKRTKRTKQTVLFTQDEQYFLDQLLRCNPEIDEIEREFYDENGWSHFKPKRVSFSSPE